MKSVGSRSIVLTVVFATVAALALFVPYDDVGHELIVMALRGAVGAFAIIAAAGIWSPDFVRSTAVSLSMARKWALTVSYLAIVMLIGLSLDATSTRSSSFSSTLYAAILVGAFRLGKVWDRSPSFYSHPERWLSRPLPTMRPGSRTFWPSS